MPVRIIISLILLGFFLLGLFYTTGLLHLVLQWFSLSLLTLFMFFFASSLFRDRTPIITRYALLMGAKDCYEERAYTRKVTWIWTVFLLLLTAFKLTYLCGCAELFAFGRVELVFYLGSLLLFITEFYVRQRVLPHHRGSLLMQFLSQLSRISFRDIWLFDEVRR